MLEHEKKEHVREFNNNIPDKVLYHPSMTLLKLRIYSIVRSFIDSHRTVYCSNNWIAKKCGVKRDAVIKAINSLVEMGFIKRVMDGDKRQLEIVFQPVINPDNEGGIPKDTGGYSETYGGGIPKDTQIDQSNNRSKNNISPYNSPLKKQEKEPEILKLDDLKKDNPHNLPEQALKDWTINRKKKKAPITPTVWKKVNKTLGNIYQQLAIKPEDAFEEMVASNWQSIKIEYFENKRSKRMTLEDVINPMGKTSEPGMYDLVHSSGNTYDQE